jgi:hypothetical protein
VGGDHAPSAIVTVRIGLCLYNSRPFCSVVMAC